MRAEQTAPAGSTSPAKAVPDEQLSEAECWRRLRLHSTARLAISTDSGVDIFPVTYRTSERAIVFRSGPGSKMLQISHHGPAALEIDGRGHGRAWSVVVQGKAERMNLDADIIASGVREIPSLHPGAKFNYVKLTPEHVSGRQFRVFTGSAPLIVIAAVLGIAVIGLAGLSIWLGR